MPNTAAAGDDTEMAGHAMIIETEREEDGRWIAEVPDLPGVMTYGGTRDEAVSKVKVLALRALADRVEHGEDVPELRELAERE